jgi:hypothetical protein
MEYDDFDPVEEVWRIRKELLEMYGGMEGLHKHMDEQRPRWEKEGWKFMTAEEVVALKKKQPGH